MNLKKSPTKPTWQRAVIVLSAVVTTAFVFSALYWMRSVFVPIALAVFFTYVLAPLVVFARRRGLGRFPAVILVVGVALLLFLGTSFLVARQLSGLSETLADNKDRIKAKLAEARATIVGDGESKWGQFVSELEETVMPGSTTQANQSVVVEPVQPKWVSQFDVVLGPASEAFGLAAFSFILVVFMLLAREDLQDRLLRLVGDSGMTSATRATGEATRRISRYLFSQMVLNVTFGVVCGLGLFLMGVQYYVLWGFIAALMRYVPYIGTWVGMLPPALFAFAVSDGWWQPLGVIALFGTLEVVCNNAIEPRLYGVSLGVSEVALLVSAAFWAFLWGPIGLILSGPIATCLVVLGKYLPPFRFLEVLLGTEPPLTPPAALYQRLMARNQDEAERVLEAAIPQGSPDEVFDTTVIPALAMMKQAKHDGGLDPDDDRRLFALTREVIDEVADEVRTRTVPGGGEPEEARVRLLACPASDVIDELALHSLTNLLSGSRWEVKVVTADALISEMLDAVDRFAPHVVCVGTMPPNGIAHVRYLCKRLRARLPNARILVGRFGDPGAAEVAESFTVAGASHVVGSLGEARNQLTGWLPVLRGEKAEPPKSNSRHSEPVGTATA